MLLQFTIYAGAVGIAMCLGIIVGVWRWKP
jgi:hypothetical protein